LDFLQEKTAQHRGHPGEAGAGAEREVHRVKKRGTERESWTKENLAVGAAEVGAGLGALGLGRFGFLLLVFGELFVGVAVGIA
jgi:hypothetical protein